MSRHVPTIDETRTFTWGRKTLGRRGLGLRGDGLTKHVSPADISPEEIEERYRIALFYIRERSRRRRMEFEA